jgi:hypothetical protein
MTLSGRNYSSHTLWIALLAVLVVPMLAWAGSDTKKSTTAAPAAHPAAAPVQHSTGTTSAAHTGPTTSTHTGTTTTTHTGATTTTHTGATTTTHTGATTTTHTGSTATQPHTGTTASTSSHGPTAPPSPAKSGPPMIHSTPPGMQAKATPNGGHVYENPATHRTITTDAQGRVRTVEAPHGIAGTMRVTHIPGGGREVVTGRPGSRVVSWGPHHGYVERPLAGRHGYYSRTYVYGGRRYAAVYREYGYHGVTYYRYVPAYYYGPHFYAWTASPWTTPASYYWGGGMAAPWFGYYSGYFAPYPAYASPDLWLTDYLFVENLKLSYENQRLEIEAEAEAGPAPTSEAASNANPTVTPEMKAMIAEEVRQQLAAEKMEAAQPASTNSAQAGADSEQAPPALTQKFFVVSSSLDVTEGGQPCTLTQGDIIERRASDPGPDHGVAVEVISSKKGDCAADSGSLAQVQLADLQEMHNQLRQQMDAGLKMLADNQAKGLPTAPAGQVRTVAEGTADPAPDADTALLAQDKDAQRLEAQLTQN